MEEKGGKKNSEGEGRGGEGRGGEGRGGEGCTQMLQV